LSDDRAGNIHPRKGGGKEETTGERRERLGFELLGHVFKRRGDTFREATVGRRHHSRLQNGRRGDRGGSGSRSGRLGLFNERHFGVDDVSHRVDILLI